MYFEIFYLIQIIPKPSTFLKSSSPVITLALSSLAKGIQKASAYETG